MAYYRTCPYCGANLDPGEPCECRKGRRMPGELPRMDAYGFVRSLGIQKSEVRRKRVETK